MDGPSWRRMPAGVRQPATMAKCVIKVMLPTPVAAALSPSEPLNPTWH